MGKEALVVLTTLSRLMAAKMDEPIVHVTIWVNVRIAIAVARSYSRVHPRRTFMFISLFTVVLTQVYYFNAKPRSLHLPAISAKHLVVRI